MSINNLVGEQLKIVHHTIFLAIKTLIISFTFLFSSFERIDSVGISISFLNISGYVFIATALLNKNIFQMKMYNFVLALEAFFWLIIGIQSQKGRYFYVVLICLDILIIIFNLISITGARSEFAWVYFRRVVSLDPAEIGKCKFLILIGFGISVKYDQMIFQYAFRL